MQTAKKKRNVAIELWRFLIAFAIIGFHTGWIIAMSCDGSLGYWMERSNWFFGSSEVLLIFTVTAGYFMVSHFTNRKNDQLYMSRSASSRAWEYTWSRIKALLPVLILGYVLGVVISTAFFYPDYTTQQVLAMVVNSVWEFLGFHAAGFRSSGNQFFNLNGTLWFISAMIIVGYFMYWALCKNEDVFCGFVAPLTFIFLGGWWCFSGTRAAQTAWSTLGLQTASTNGMGGSAGDTTAMLGFNNGLLYVMLGMMGGCLVYYLVKQASNHTFTSTGKALLTLVNIVCSVLLLWYTIYQPTYFMPLKDAAGLVKMYSMVNVQQYQIVAVGNSVAECEANYLKLLSNDNVISGDPSTSSEITGEIAEIRSAVIDGNTVYYIRLTGGDSYYMISASSSEIAPILNVGDEVAIMAGSGDGELISAYSLERAE